MSIKIDTSVAEFVDWKPFLIRVFLQARAAIPGALGGAEARLLSFGLIRLASGGTRCPFKWSQVRRHGHSRNSALWSKSAGHDKFLRAVRAGGGRLQVRDFLETALEFGLKLHFGAP